MLADDFCSFVDASPSPFHVCATAADRLVAAGFHELSETAAWPADGRYFVRRGGSLIAWTSIAEDPGAGFSVIGCHTDSPNLRVKPRHDIPGRGTGVLALEPYGGALVDTWLDRDLGISGRLVTYDGAEHLVAIHEPVARIPHLAIHLDRDNSKPDRQHHLNAIWSVNETEFLPWLAARASLSADAIAGFDLMTHPVAPAARFGADKELISAPRLDNQVTCFAALHALLAPAASGRCMVAMFDHEEVGSTSERGAQSEFLLTTIERVVLANGGSREDVHRAVAASLCVSGDMAHATHPNYPEKHEPLHQIRMGGGPVLKIHPNLRYATDPRGTAAFAAACRDAGVSLQRYAHRADMPCGSTIGPISAARTGILTVDVGAPQLAMHSAHEMMAADDIDAYTAALTAFLAQPR